MSKECFGEYILCSVLTSNLQLEAIWSEGVAGVLRGPGGAAGGVLMSPVSWESSYKD